MAARWRRISEVNGPFDRPTPVCCYCSVDNPRRALTVFDLLPLFHSDKTDRKQKSAAADADHWK
jgi:hypothetical protein